MLIPLPSQSDSSNCWSTKGGGCFDHARQYRRSMIHGSNHARTCRNATGHETFGRWRSRMIVFFLHGWFAWPFIWRDTIARTFTAERDGRAVAGVPPTKRECAAYQAPMALDCRIRTYLILRPTECALDVLVVLFNPHAEAIQPHNLFQRCCPNACGHCVNFRIIWRGFFRIIWRISGTL